LYINIIITNSLHNFTIILVIIEEIEDGEDFAKIEGIVDNGNIEEGFRGYLTIFLARI
jgi:hypothetical protein